MGPFFPVKEFLSQIIYEITRITRVVQPFVVPEGQEAREGGERCKCGTP